MCFKIQKYTVVLTYLHVKWTCFNENETFLSWQIKSKQLNASDVYFNRWLSPIHFLCRMLMLLHHSKNLLFNHQWHHLHWFDWPRVNICSSFFQICVHLTSFVAPRCQIWLSKLGGLGGEIATWSSYNWTCELWYRFIVQYKLERHYYLKVT